MSNTSNILLQPFQTPFKSIPFQQIAQDKLADSILSLIAAAKNNIDSIATQSTIPTFENTIEALENNGKHLGVLTSVLFNLHSAETNDVIEAAANIISPALASFGNDITLNPTLFKRVKLVYDTADSFSLNAEQKRLLEKTYKSFVRNGALLDDDSKARLRAIDEKLSLLALTFSQHVLQATNGYFLHLKHEEDLAGLPTPIVEMAAQEAKQRALEGWVFTLQF